MYICITTIQINIQNISSIPEDSLIPLSHPPSLISAFQWISYACFWTSYKWNKTTCIFKSLFCLTRLIFFLLLCSHSMKYTVIYLSIPLLVDIWIIYSVFTNFKECCHDHFSMYIFWYTPRSGTAGLYGMCVSLW